MLEKVNSWTTKIILVPLKVNRFNRLDRLAVPHRFCGILIILSCVLHYSKNIRAHLSMLKKKHL